MSIQGLYFKLTKQMKFITIILTLLASSCSKPATDPVTTAESVTYLATAYTPDWKPLTTDTIIHWCKVSGEELQYYKNKAARRDTLCGEFKIMRVVTGPDNH